MNDTMLDNLKAAVLSNPYRAADDLLLEIGVNPIQKLIEIAESDLASVDQKINCYKTIAQYTYPKLKSQEIFVDSESSMPTRIEIVAYGEDNI